MTVADGDTALHADLSTEGFWPLAVGNYWTYDAIEDGMAFLATLEITDTYSKDGKTYFVRLNDLLPVGMDPVQYWDLVGREGDTYYMFARWEEENERWYFFSDPSVEANAPMQEGAVGDSDFAEVTYSIEEVATSAGSFEAVKRIARWTSLDLDMEPHYEELHTSWYVPYLGMVRYEKVRFADGEAVGEYRIELVDYDVSN